jgi:hypothetical protein
MWLSHELQYLNLIAYKDLDKFGTFSHINFLLHGLKLGIRF